jgi:hypothetical protein
MPGSTSLRRHPLVISRSLTLARSLCRPADESAFPLLGMRSPSCGHHGPFRLKILPCP